MNDVEYADEIWKAIPGFEGKYEASSLGRIRSLPRTVIHHWKSGDREHRIAGKLLGGKSCGVGYWGVNLGRAAIRYVHRLVCEAFHGPQPEGHEVGHLNGIRTDNRAANLAWVTRMENASHRIVHGTSCRGEAHPSAILSDEIVLSMRAERRAGAKVCDIAKKYGLNPGTTADATNGRRWGHLP